MKHFRRHKVQMEKHKKGVEKHKKGMQKHLWAPRAGDPHSRVCNHVTELLLPQHHIRAGRSTTLMVGAGERRDPNLLQRGRISYCNPGKPEPKSVWQIWEQSGNSSCPPLRPTSAQVFAAEGLETKRVTARPLPLRT